ncbi:TolA-binding protein [Desulfofundulus luciae]|uniref:TolA-binding protein n=1 Tax=Desulfofundulus luciae TaxID=74702 RepID=A0ABU0B355_9FIRM|nr:hypothetical protein [Desulfofundulus luciae]MDQ0286690.1 TolA-binding protein [Desulfofundulus luciae]
MSLLSRQDFIKRTLAAGVASGLVLSGLGKAAEGATITHRETFYDLTKCDGCQGLKMPWYVSACREENSFKFPQPAENIEYKDLKGEIARLEEEIAELKRRWPAHSVKAEMVEQLEELEEKLDRLRQMEQQEGSS